MKTVQDYIADIEATNILPIKPWGYEAREAVKKLAWETIYSPAATMTNKALAVLNLCEAHYWRARPIFDRMPLREKRKINKRAMRGYSLDLDLYTRHWMAANNNESIAAILPFVTQLYHYTPLKTKYLPAGQSEYVLGTRGRT